ncbi:MAG: asparagine synthase (glutamine-hydrolyzing) [Rhodospirillales bacterium]
MCGIFGFIGPGETEDLVRMGKALAHRGPDGDGMKIFPDQSLFLGHRRLSIIDLAGGAQPMTDRDGAVWVTFNGEIYNHAALRAELSAHGHVFQTDHSDTEVLIHGWKEWGTDLPSKLNGMFAFAIWDTRRNTLFLARDRFGEKPLFWARQNGLFLFASELSGLCAHRRFRTALNPNAVKKYFAHGFIPSPNAAYTDTHKLAPGSWLLYEPGQPDIQLSRYWRYRVEPDAKAPSLDESAEEVRHLITQSVQRRLMSDVPLGLFLSGGIDSGAAAAAMCRLRSAADVRAFGVGFTEPSFDESGHARHVADHLGLQLDIETLDMAQAETMIPSILGALDEPMADASILPTTLLSRFTRQYVTVALSGDGGDELFAGYDPFVALRPAAVYHATVPRPLHRLFRRLADLLPVSAANMSLDFKIRRTLQGLNYGPELWNPAWLAPLEARDIADLFHEPVQVEDLYSEALELWHQSSGHSVVDRTLEFFGNFYLPDGVLTKVDRASMRHGLEVRPIFLDNDLVEFVRRLPSAYKTSGRQRKIILKRALRGILPDTILDRPKKGFGIPLQTWLRHMSLDTRGHHSLGLKAAGIEQRIAAHRAGHADHRLFLWSWNVLQSFLPAAGDAS